MGSGKKLVPSTLTALVVLVAASGCGGNHVAASDSHHTHVRTPRTVPLSEEAMGAPIEFGTIKSIAPDDHGYRVIFDLGLILYGATGVQACIDNGQCPKIMRHNTGFPDDIARADLHFVVPFYMPPTALVILNNGGGEVRCNGRGLYLLYSGRSAPRACRAAQLGPRLSYAFGWWIKTTHRLATDKQPLDVIMRIDQEFHP